MTSREVVTVCQLNDQWGLWLPGCKEHITNYRTKDLSSKQSVLDAIEQIKAYWYADYGDELPWAVQVIE